MKLSEKIKKKVPEHYFMRASKTYRVIKTIINVVCWIVVAVLAVVMVAFLVSRINGGSPSVFGYTFHRISSGSMEPELMVGDVILDKEVSDVNEIKKGDIITFQGGAQYDNHLVTHRVVKAPYTENGIVMLQTKGDANNVEDDPISAETVRSKYLTKVTFLAGLYSFFLSPWGLLTFIAVLFLIFFDEIINIIKIVSGHYDEEDDNESISEIIERIRKEEEEKKKAAMKSETENNKEN